MLGKLVRALVGGLMLAGVVHVVTVLAIPNAAKTDAVDRIHRAAPPGRVGAGAAPRRTQPPKHPRVVHPAGPSDLSAGPVEISGTMPADVWTLTVVTENGGVVSSLERATTVNGQLDLVVGGVAAIERLRLAIAGSGRDAIFVSTPVDRGFVLLRAYVSRGADREELSRQLTAIDCSPV